MKKHWPKLLVGGSSLLYLMVWTALSFGNHYTFRTYALDLGYSLQLIDMHSRGNIIPQPITSSSPFLDENSQKVTPHMSFSVLLAVPFYWIGGVWGVLAFQVVCVAAGAWGMFLFARAREGDWRAGWLTMLHFTGMWGIYAALAYDWHEIVIGAMALPFFWYAVETRRVVLALGSWFVFVCSKENLALWGIWLLPWFALLYREKWHRKVFLVCVGLVVGWSITSHLLYTGGSSRLNLYAYLNSSDPIAAFRGLSEHRGFSYGAMLRLFLSRPQLIWTLLWESPVEAGWGIKSELHWAVLWSGGWAFFFQPLFLVMLLPVYLYKLLASDFQIWGILHHYSLEYAVILPIATLFAVSRWRGKPLYWIGLIGGIIGAHGISTLLHTHPYSKWYDATRHQWYKKEHYTSLYCYSLIHEGLKVIPREVPVSAVSRLLPHIPPREGYYHFPAVKQAEYLALLREDPNPWPFPPGEPYKKYIDSVSASPFWEKVWDRDKLVIFRRRQR